MVVVRLLPARFPPQTFLVYSYGKTDTALAVTNG